MVTIREPDEMGVWAEGGETIWLPRSRYPKRIDAILWAMDQWRCSLPEVRCVSRWMRFEAHDWEETWWECEQDDPGAFRVWRIEGA